MAKRLLLFTGLCLYAFTLFGQLVPPCPSNTQPPADNCGDCIYCGFNGVMSSTAGYSPGSVPGFCGSIENNQWLGFIAGETGATFSAIPTSCTNGDGVQIALLDATCSSLLGCYGGQGGGASVPATISINNMVLGQTYYLMIDGFAGDQCSFTIAVSPNSAIVPPLPIADSISGPDIVCPNITTQYCTPAINGAAAYVWNAPPGALINGQPGPITILGNAGLCVDITWPANATAGPVIVNGINSCFSNTPPAIQIVQSIPLPPVIESQPPVCQEDFPHTLVWGTTVGGPGAYDHTYQIGPGCDSVVTHIITPIVVPPTILQPQTICQGQSVQYCNEQFSTSGAFDATCTNIDGCDSIVKVILIVIDINPAIQPAGIIDCNNPTTTLYATPGPGVHAWFTGNGTPAGFGDSLVVSAPGTYILESAAPTGTTTNCVLYDTITVLGNLTPPSVTTTGGTLGCGGSTQITVSSNAANPSYAWGPGATPANTAAPTVSSPGNYVVTVTNQATGCTNTGIAEVLGSTDIPIVSLAGNNLNCSITSSTITATSSIPTSTYLWSTGGTTSSITTTTAGTYTVTVTDPANNCTNTQGYVVASNTTAPMVSAQSTGQLTCATLTLPITTTADSTNLNYAWSSGSATTSNIDVTMPGTYTVTATASNGCTSTASATITQNIAVPTVTTTTGQLTCDVTSIPLTANSPAMGATYNWGGGNTNALNQVSTPGSYTVTATGTNGCTSTVTATVTQNTTPPNASATGGIITCTQSSTMLTGSSTTSGVSYNWTGPNGGSYPGATPTVQETGMYTLLVTNNTNGCTATATATVDPDAGIPNAAATGGILNCTNTMITINGTSTTPGVTMAWNGPAGMLTGASPMVSDSGTYTLIVTDPANGCTAVATTTVAQNLTTPGYNLTPGIVTCADPNTTIQLVLTPSNQTGLTYDWSGPGVSNPSGQNAMVSAPGNYSVIVTGTNGCTTEQTTNVPADTNIPTAMGTAEVLTCTKTTVPIQLNIMATGTVTGTAWSSPAGFSSTVEDPMVTEPGDYSVIVTTDNGCSSTAIVEVTQDIVAPDLTADAGIIGCAAPSTQISATSTAATSYAWTGVGGFTSISAATTVSQDGDYTVIARGANGCTSIETVTVTTDYDSASIAIAPTLLLDCTNDIISIDATITSNTVPVESINWTSTSGYSNTTDEDPSNITEPGTYFLLVRTTNGCTSTESILVEQYIEPPGAVGVGGELTCTVTTDTLFAFSPEGIEFEWTTPGGAVLTNQNPIVDVPGVYELLVTGANGCTSASSAEIVLNGDFPENVAIAAPVTEITCDVLQVELTASTTTPGVSYAWFDGNGMPIGTDATIIADIDDTYTVEITDLSNGCVTPTQQTVSINQVLPDAAAMGDTTDCISGTGTLVGTSLVSGAVYTWTNPSGSSITGQTITVGATGTYTLTVRDPSNGCTQTATAVLDANTDSPVISVAVPGNVLDCNVLDINLAGTVTSPANPTVTWMSNGATVGSTNNLTVTTAGTYIFNVVDPANNCVTSFEAVITDNYAEPQVTTADNLINCSTPTVTISATSTTTGVAYEWTAPNSTVTPGANVVADEAGVYTVLVTGPNGCTSTETSTVDQDFDIPQISFTTETITCAVQTIVLDSESDVAVLDYVWSGPNGLTLPNVADPTTMVDGAYTLVVTNPVNGCTNEATETVPLDQTAPNASALGSILTCDVTSVEITAASTTTGVTYTWYLNGNQISTDQNPTVDQATDYTVVVTDPTNGCTAEAVATVEPDENLPDIATQGGNIDCAIPMINIAGSSATPNVTFNWSGPNGFTSTDENPAVDAAGNYSLTVTSLDNGCSTTETATVTADFAEPTITIAPPDQIDCNNSSVVISSSATGQGSVSYDWTAVSGIILAGGTSQNPEVGAGTYTVVVTSTGNGCTSSEGITVEADPATPSGVANTVRNISCFGETDGSIILQNVVGGTPPFMYSLDNQPFSAQTQWTFLEPGVYPLTIQDVLGCEFSTSFTILEPEELMLDLGPDLISADAGPDQLLFLGDSVSLFGDMTINFPDRVDQLLVTPNEMYQYICDTCQGNYFKAFYTQRYEVTIVDSNGCKASDERLIVVDRTRNVYVPNVFNPDATDGSNHLLTVYGNLKHVTRIKSFKLFDRWGEAIHEALDFAPNTTDQAWDGTYQGKRVNPAVFVWVAEVEFIDGVIELYKGDVAVIGN